MNLHPYMVLNFLISTYYET